MNMIQLSHRNALVFEFLKEAIFGGGCPVTGLGWKISRFLYFYSSVDTCC